MDTEQLIQRTPEWHEFRRTGIGSSEASAIMGVSPFNSRYQLWLEKVGLKEGFKGNYHTERGLLLEQPALEWAEREIGVKFRPCVKKHRDYDWIYASFDGVSDDLLAIEIKCPANGLHDTIPDHYFPQLQHQMEVLGVKHMIYMSFDGIQGNIIYVKRDDEYIEKLIEAERLFWNNVVTFTEPELTEKDYVKRDDDKYRETLMIYLNNKKQAKFWEDICNKSKDDLTSLTETNTVCMGCKISKRIRVGNVDYKQLTKDLGIEKEVIDDYRKKSSTYWDIR